MATRICALIVALFACSANAQTFVWTNTMGQLEFSGNRKDALYAVGAVQTSAVMPQVQLTEWDIAPDITVPILDGTNVIGTARLIATPELSLVMVTNSASPQRLKSVQMADIVSKAAARKAKIVDIKAKSAAANSVPALREEVRRIAELLESNQ